MSAALSLESLKSRADGLSFRNQVFIGGRYVDAADGKSFACINPATGTFR